MNRNVVIVIIILLVVAVICVCALIGASALFIFQARSISSSQATEEVFVATSTPRVVRPTEAAQTPPTTEAETPEPGLPTAAPGEIPPTSGLTGEQAGAAAETLKVLQEIEIPVNDPPTLYARLDGKEALAPEPTSPSAVYKIGDQKTFYVADAETNEHNLIHTTLRAASAHSYFWIENGVRYNEQDIQTLAEVFENKVYPTNREFFGSENTPGIDGDPHLYIVIAKTLGGSVAGYFSSTDSYPSAFNQYSNMHEMFLLSARLVDLGGEDAYGTLAHELQHMIHWERDRNEDIWMNEGFSDLAMFINGYDTGGHEYAFIAEPDTQLNDWSPEPGENFAHYGASFMFFTYFLDRFGEDTTKALVGLDANGLDSIDEILSEDGAQSSDGQPLTADAVFADWVVATYLQDGSIDDGHFVYHNFPDAPTPSETETIRDCPQDFLTRDVHQYGVDYIRITCSGSHTLRFEGSMEVDVVPADPHSGSYAYWSNKGDQADMTLTREFDFSQHNGSLTLQYWTWYDIEDDYDYLYLEASTDGENWQILQTPTSTDADPSGNSYGWAYNGMSGFDAGEWIEETVDLSLYAGQKVWLRFEYVTDGAVNGEGLLLDDLSIPEIGYSTGFESADESWQALGFARIQNILPQTFRISVIRQGAETTVEQFSLSGENTLEIPLEIGSGVDEAIVVVSGTTRYTRQKAAYRFSLD